TGRRDPTRDPTRVGDELAQRVLGVDPHLDGVSLPVDVLLCETELEIRGDANLLLDEVDARHRLGDRMLDLQPSVDLEEVEVAVAEDELDRPGVDVTRRFRGADCRVRSEERRVGKECRWRWAW